MSKGVEIMQKTAAVRRGEDLCDSVSTNKMIVAKAFYEIGTALAELEKRELWKPLGHASFQAMLDDRDLVGRSQAYKFMRVARSFTAHVARELGVEKSDAIVKYAEATAQEGSAAMIMQSGIKIDGKLHAVVDLSARDILREAQKTRQNRKNAHRDPARKSAQALSRTAEKALTSALGERVTVTPQRQGKGWVVTLTVSLAALEEVQRAMEGQRA